MTTRDRGLPAGGVCSRICTGGRRVAGTPPGAGPQRPRSCSPVTVSAPCGRCGRGGSASKDNQRRKTPGLPGPIRRRYAAPRALPPDDVAELVDPGLAPRVPQRNRRLPRAGGAVAGRSRVADLAGSSVACVRPDTRRSARSSRPPAVLGESLRHLQVLALRRHLPPRRCGGLVAWVAWPTTACRGRSLRRGVAGRAAVWWGSTTDHLRALPLLPRTGPRLHSVPPRPATAGRLQAPSRRASPSIRASYSRPCGPSSPRPGGARVPIPGPGAASVPHQNASPWPVRRRRAGVGRPWAYYDASGCSPVRVGRVWSAL